MFRYSQSHARTTIMMDSLTFLWLVLAIIASSAYAKGSPPGKWAPVGKEEFGKVKDLTIQSWDAKLVKDFKDLGIEVDVITEAHKRITDKGTQYIVVSMPNKRTTQRCITIFLLPKSSKKAGHSQEHTPICFVTIDAELKWYKNRRLYHYAENDNSTWTPVPKEGLNGLRNLTVAALKKNSSKEKTKYAGRIDSVVKAEQLDAKEATYILEVVKLTKDKHSQGVFLLKTDKDRKNAVVKQGPGFVHEYEKYVQTRLAKDEVIVHSKLYPPTSDEE